MRVGLGILCFSSLFLRSSLFINPETTPKWYAFIFITALLGLIIIVSNFFHKYVLKTNFGEIILLAFAFYIYFRNYLINGHDLKLFTYLTTFILIYCITSSINIIQNFIFLSLLIVFPTTLQTIYSLLRNIFFYPENFDNPAGLVASILCGLPFCFYLLTCRQKKIQLLSIFSTVCIILVIITSNSRAGILALICSGLFFYWNKIKARIYKYKTYVCYFAFLIFIPFITILYFLKKDSADGRLLIWNCTCDILKNKLLFGYGVDGFTTNYMLSQANYFAHHSHHHFEMLADNVKHPFNEYLKLGMEQGLIGLSFIFIVILWYFLDKKKNYNILKKKMAQTLLLSLGVFANFSYPLSYPFVWLCIIISLVILFNNTQQILVPQKIKYLQIGACFLICPILLHNTIQITSAQIKWKHLIKQSVFEETKAIFSQYENLKPILRNEPIFFYNYARELFEHGYYEESIQNLSICQKRFNDTDIQLLLAENYTKLKNFAQAENALLLAAHMCPNRFIPLYKLVLLYDCNGDYLRAKKIAQIIIDKQIKTQSPIINNIKNEMLNYLH